MSEHTHRRHRLEFVVRRLLSVLSLTFVLSAFLLAFALPSFATEASDDTVETTEAEPVEADHAPDSVQDDHADEVDDSHASAAPDDDDQWLGLKGALVAGVLFGAFVFFVAGTDGLGEDHH